MPRQDYFTQNDNDRMVSREQSSVALPRRYDSSSRVSDRDQPPSYSVMESIPVERAASSGSIPHQDEDRSKALQRRVKELEQENEKLKASVFMLTEKLNRRRDSSMSLESILAASSSQAIPPQSLTPSPTIVPLPSATRRLSNEVSAIHARHNKSNLITDDDLDDSIHLNGHQFACRATFLGHSSAVYQCRFLPDSYLLASTSQDCTVRVWNAISETDVIVGKHAQSGSDLAWISPVHVATSGLDMSVKVWDINKPNPDTPLNSFATQGLALCVSTMPEMSSLAAGTSAGAVVVFDARAGHGSVSSTSSDGGGHSSIFHAEGAVNAICCNIPNTIISGDSKGMLRAFDTRMAGHHDLFTIEGKRPISGLAWSSAGFLAVNSYDNMLRIFMKAESTDAVKLVHSLRGQKTKNLPIRSAFSSETRGSIFIATGSANGSCYAFAPLTPSFLPPPPTLDDCSSQVTCQQLQGHTGSVYACDVSHDNIIASCSADGTIKLWSKRS